MSEPRDQFMFFRSYFDAVSYLPDEDKAAVILAIAGYALYGIEPELEGVQAAIFTLVRPTLDVSRIKAESGRIGGSRSKKKPNGNQTVSKTQAEPKQATITPEANGNQTASYKDKEVDKDKDKDKDIKKKASTPSRFTPPTVDDIRSYCMERGNDVDPERFYDFYASKGWRVGQNPMKDWRAAVRTWERRDDRQTNAVSFPARQDNRNDNPFLQMLREEELYR